MGHAGTLDPMATGVLIICLGGATRLSEYAMHTTKRYRATVRLGSTTDTYDAEGEVLTQTDASHITRTDVEQALLPFIGEIEQYPPMYSAIKQGGHKLYELARAGEVVERQARLVTIERLTLEAWSSPEFVLDVVCSSGTYIRSLAYDLGEALGVGAHLSGLVRTASGAFHLEDAVDLESLLADDDWAQHLWTPERALADWPALHLSAEDADHVLHGRAIQGYTAAGEMACAYAPDGQLIAILKADALLWKPHKVFNS